MSSLEVALLFVLLLFPFADVALEQYKFNSKSMEYIKSAAMLWAVTGLLWFGFAEGLFSVAAPYFVPTVALKYYLALALCLAFLFYMYFVLSTINKNAQVRRQVLNAFNEGGDALNALLPQSRQEYLLFTLLVSVTAGICEELIFRWYLYHFLASQTHWLLAIIGSSMVFGLWHLYLGWRHVGKAAIAGLVLSGIYLYFESIIVAIVAHILMDIYSGTIAYVAKKAAVAGNERKQQSRCSIDSH